jgi:hypothetical protein
VEYLFDKQTHNNVILSPQDIHENLIHSTKKDLQGSILQNAFEQPYTGTFGPPLVDRSVTFHFNNFKLHFIFSFTFFIGWVITFLFNLLFVIFNIIDWSSIPLMIMKSYLMKERVEGEGAASTL